MKQVVVLAIVAMVGGCVGLTKPEGHDERELPEAHAEVELAASLDECNRACRNGQQAMEQFCYGLPDPRMRASCWAVAKLSLAACLGWCYANFGN